MTNVLLVHKIQVNAPLEAAFDYVSDLTRHPEWSSGRLEIKAVTQGPVEIGKEYISHGEFAIQKDRQNTVRITQYEPPHRFGFVARDPAVGEVSHVFTLDQNEDGVLVTRTMTLSLNPIVAFLFRFFTYPFLGAPSMDRSLRSLKIKLEHTRGN